MFREEQGDPTPSDIGKFLPESELLAWHKKMQQKCPLVFTKDDKLFGHIGGQHPMTTKLMSYFDDDPNKPMRIEVLGSRWMKEFGDTSPVYVVRFKDIQSELSQIQLTSAHEEGGWQVGWDVPPPTK